MVCSRCRMVVKSELDKIGLPALSVDLVEVELAEEPTRDEFEQLDKALKQFGFELISDKKSRVIEKIKNLLVDLVVRDQNKPNVNLSVYLAEKLHKEYTSLSSLFSEVEGTTIEKYFISLRIEKVKELLVYDEMTLSEIADKLGYSSSAYLSSQFKQVTGLTPSFYKGLKEHKRRNIDDL